MIPSEVGRLAGGNILSTLESFGALSVRPSIAVGSVHGQRQPAMLTHEPARGMATCYCHSSSLEATAWSFYFLVIHLHSCRHTRLRELPGAPTLSRMCQRFRCFRMQPAAVGALSACKPTSSIMVASDCLSSGRCTASGQHSPCSCHCLRHGVVHVRRARPYVLLMQRRLDIVDIR